MVRRSPKAEARKPKPASPDHTEKRTLFDLLDAERMAGIRLTESYAMYPAASVSGLYFAHPEARYFAASCAHFASVLRKGFAAAGGSISPVSAVRNGTMRP